jgi:hypothetical protein
MDCYMTDRAESNKLAELRSKTDRQLLVLVGSKLDAALRHAQRTGDFSRAQKSHAEAKYWLSLVKNAPQAEIRRLERKLDELNYALQPRPHAACA